MPHTPKVLSELKRIHEAARASDDGNRCAVAPHPDLKDAIEAALRDVNERGIFPDALSMRASEPKRVGFNDGVIIPPNLFPLGTAPSRITNAAAERAPLRGTLRVIVVLVDFSDHAMTTSQNHFRDLFFSTGVIPTRSVREYYTDVTNGLIDIQGDVVGPFRLPQTLATYAHGAAGIGAALPNAQTMARDALLAANPSVNFAPYDNDGNGFVDAFIVIHAGTGGEVSGSSGDIWSHKWTVEGGAQSVDGTKVFAYLTVPEDCRIGVCAHELGHLLFGFPDLYDTDGSSEGIGNFCLMAAGSWGGGGNTPTHPSAWCKANQGWVATNNRTSNGVVSVQDVKTSHTVYRLWNNGGAGSEYFLVENRQQAGFDASLPGGGLLIWHIDESVSTNTNENHYKVALMQADGLRDMELHHSRGDAGDPYPGSHGNTVFNKTSTPNSKSYSGADTCVGVTAISVSGPAMTANLQVSCVVKIKEIKEKEKKEFKEKEKKEIKEKEKKEFKEKEKKEFKEVKEKEFKEVKEKEKKEFKEIKELKEKEKNPKEIKEGKFSDKFSEGKFAEVFHAEGGGGLADLEARLSAIEHALGIAGGEQSGEEPFIGMELRPDLSQSAFSEEPEMADVQADMASGSAQAKRHFDSKQQE